MQSLCQDQSCRPRKKHLPLIQANPTWRMVFHGWDHLGSSPPLHHPTPSWHPNKIIFSCSSLRSVFRKSTEPCTPLNDFRLDSSWFPFPEFLKRGKTSSHFVRTVRITFIYFRHKNCHVESLPGYPRSSVSSSKEPLWDGWQMTAQAGTRDFVSSLFQVFELENRFWKKFRQELMKSIFDIHDEMSKEWNKY